MGGWSMIGRRLVQMIPIIFGIPVVSFVLIRIVPGDPATLILGNHYTPQGAEQIQHALGLDRSIAVQYWLFLKSAATGSFGHSYSLNSSVGQLILRGLAPPPFLIRLSGIF